MPFKSSGRGAYGPQGQKVIKGPLAPVWVSSGTLSQGTPGTAYSVQLSATDDSGDAPTYTVASGALPTGLSLSSSGLISGTPSSAGTFTFAVNATDVNGRATTSSNFTIVIVNPLLNVTFTVPDITQNPSGPLSDSQLIAGETFTTLSAASINMTRSNGFRYFTLPAGTYTVTVAGASGSSPEHGYGIIRRGTMVLGSSTNMMALVGHNGQSSYGGGGMSGLAIGTNNASATPIFVAGGGGGGYGGTNPARDGQEGTSGGGGAGSQNYDSGAGWFSNASRSYSNGEPRARSVTNGANGGNQNACGGSGGGFGGGGGNCPAGGGGYTEGGAGGDGGPFGGGGGGGSYHTSPVSSVTTIGYRGTNRSSTWSSLLTSESGYITIQRTS